MGHFLFYFILFCLHYFGLLAFILEMWHAGLHLLVGRDAYLCTHTHTHTHTHTIYIYIYIYIYICWVQMLRNEKTILTIVLQKNKEIYFFVRSWNIEVYTAIRVSSHDRKGQFRSQRGWDLYPTWNCNMTPLFEDQTNKAPLRKQFIRFTPGRRE